jgi:hypothetical protein
VNDVMRRAGMVWIFLVDLERDRAGLGLQAITFSAACHAEQ